MKGMRYATDCKALETRALKYALDVVHNLTMGEHAEAARI